MRGLKSMSPAVIVLACLAGSPVLAQDAKSLPQSRADMQMSFAPLVKQTHGAVVNVYAERIVQSRVNPFAA